MATAKKTAGVADAFESLTAMNPEVFKEGYDRFAKSISSFADFQKNSLEALMASAGSFAKGVEKLTTEQAAFAKASYEDSVAAAKAAAASKSVQEALDIQSDYVRTTFEKNLGQFNKIADQWVSTTKAAAEPLTARYGEFVDIVQSYRP
ncbi:MAG: phasin family protein [Amphiplicatus sp.]